MRLPIALNTILGSALVIALVFANFIRKYNADRSQQLVFGSLLFFTFVSMMADLTQLLIEGYPGRGVYVFSYGICAVFYLAQVLSYFYIMMFIDHMVFKSPGRTRKLTVVVCMATLVHAVLLALNFTGHFYFYIDPITNVFYRGDRYYIRLAVAYTPMLFAVGDLILFHKTFKRSHLLMMFLLLGFSCFGSSMDLLFNSARLVWPCMTAGLLYSYFFIIQSDTRLDSLTGIGNRFSFNEFTDRLSRHNSGEAWAIVMIDMDHFKQINDTLGHQEGDSALRDMAAIIKSCVRSSDFAARYGGDEFVLATRMNNGIVRLMRNIQDAVDQHNAKNIRPFKLEISYGYDVYVADGSRSIEEFLTHIDGLMYKHKQERRRASDKPVEAEL